MAVNQVYQSLRIRLEKDRKITSLTFEGNEQEINDFIIAKPVGSIDAAYGTVTAAEKRQSGGERYHAVYEWELARGIPTGTATTAEYPELDCKMLKLPLAAHPDYRANWDHHLVSINGSTAIPAWWETDTTPYKPGSPTQHGWIWVKEWPQYPEYGYAWKGVAERTVKGNMYDWPVYELRETARHNNMNQAGWALDEAAGTICFPLSGDFGITDRRGGNWLCEGGSIRFDGRFWLASMLYAHSPDGWDEKLYKRVDAKK